MSIPTGAVLNISGTVDISNGVINNDGTLNNHGTINNCYAINNHGVINNYATIRMGGTGTCNFGFIQNFGTINNACSGLIFDPNLIFASKDPTNNTLSPVNITCQIHPTLQSPLHIDGASLNSQTCSYKFFLQKIGNVTACLGMITLSNPGSAKISVQYGTIIFGSVPYPRYEYSLSLGGPPPNGVGNELFVLNPGETQTYLFYVYWRACVSARTTNPLLVTYDCPSSLGPASSLISSLNSTAFTMTIQYGLPPVQYCTCTVPYQNATITGTIP